MTRFRFIAMDGTETEVADLLGLADAVRAKRIHADTLVFDARVNRWSRAAEMDLLQLAFMASAPAAVSGSARDKPGPSTIRPPSHAADKLASANQHDTSLSQNDRSSRTHAPHPWRRFWARLTDYALWGVPASICLDLLFPEWAARQAAEDMDTFYFALINTGSWIFIEATLIATLGWTPGKKALGITILDSNGTKPGIASALSRASDVWVRGVACGFPLVNLFTMTKAHVDLRDKGRTSWDAAGGFVVHHRRPSVVGVLVVVGALVLSLLGLAMERWQAL